MIESNNVPCRTHIITKASKCISELNLYIHQGILSTTVHKLNQGGLTPHSDRYKCYASYFDCYTYICNLKSSTDNAKCNL